MATFTMADLAQVIAAGTKAGAEGDNQYVKGAQQSKLSAQEAQQTQAQTKLKDYLQGQTEQSRADRAKALLNDPSITDNVNNGGGYSVNPETGAVDIRGNPYARMAMQGPHQADTFLKNAQAAYKGINSQLDAGKTTLDNLDLGNATGDKMAMMSEAQLGLGGGGSRAMGQAMSALSGDPTMASDSTKWMNYLQNTPNIPTLQPAQRDAIREAAFSRLGQLQQQKEQADQQLALQGPAIAPQADTSALLQSVSAPVGQKLAQMQKAQQTYQSQRQQMQQQGNAPVSAPATANANPSTFEKLKSFFNPRPSPQQQQAPATATVDHADALAQELAKRAQGALNQPPQGQQPAPQGQ